MNSGNEWLKALEGQKSVGRKAIQTARLPSQYVSRGQRSCVAGERSGPGGIEKNTTQKKATGNG